MAPTFRKIILHIGTEKTGTSAIQRFLWGNRARLVADGFVYSKFLSPGPVSQWEFAAAVHDAPWGVDLGRALALKAPDDQVALRSALTENLGRLAEKSKGEKSLIISSEHLHSRLRNISTIAALRELLAPFAQEFEIIVYFRRQDRVAISALSTRIKSGALKYKRGFPKVKDGTAPRYYWYDQIYQEWAEVFGAENITARLYDQATGVGGVVNDFCDVAQISLAGKVIPNRQNVSFNKEGFHFALALNELLPDGPDFQKNKERIRLINLISEMYPGKYYPVDADMAKEFYGQFRESNERLRKRAFPNFPAPLFDEDFSEYPDEKPHDKPNHRDAVAIAIALERRARQSNPLFPITQRISNMLRRFR